MTIEDTWYWDRRSDKAYYPLEVDEETVTLVSVWHRDEVDSAIETGAFDDVDALGGENVGFDHFDSFRLLDEDELQRLGDGDE